MFDLLPYTLLPDTSAGQDASRKNAGQNTVQQKCRRLKKPAHLVFRLEGRHRDP